MTKTQNTTKSKTQELKDLLQGTHQIALLEPGTSADNDPAIIEKETKLDRTAHKPIIELMQELGVFTKAIVAKMQSKKIPKQIKQVIAALPTKSAWYLNTLWHQIGADIEEGKLEGTTQQMVEALTKYITANTWNAEVTLEAYYSLEFYHGDSASATSRRFSPYAS